MRGSTLNQFSADEHNGYFRIATTDSGENRVTILDENLNQVSELTGLAKGERIYSCKFMGEKAYLVTFRQTDPLFTLDLSNEKAPKVAGELKLPGFSNYLYPFGERYLVGVGMNTDENGSVNGMRVNLFDVSDPENPKLSDARILTGGFHALAGITHKAFYKDPQNGVFGFPICSYDQNEFNGFVLFSEKNGKLEVKQELGYTAKAAESASNGELLWTSDDGSGLVSYNYNGFYIQRGVYVGNTLYLLSEHQLDAYDRESLAYLNSFDLD